MKKIMCAMALVLVLSGCKSGNEVPSIYNMKDLIEVHGENYRVYEANSTVFLILCDDNTMYAFSNNVNLGKVHSYNKTLEDTKINFEDGTELIVRK